MDLVAAKIDKLLECPICLDVMKIPIVQCEVGHSMCTICLKPDSPCPICRGPISTKTRNFAFEEMIKSFSRCKFHNFGCTFRDLGSDDQFKLTDHESDCKFRQIKCEISNFHDVDCKWTGALNGIARHFKEHHKDFVLYFNPYEYSELYDIFEFDMLYNQTQLQLVNFNNGHRYFWFKIKTNVALKKVYFIFQLIGTWTEANDFIYCIKIVNGPNRKMMVTQLCEYDGHDINQLCNKEKCAVFSFQTLQHFLRNDGSFKYMFSIDWAK